jgi:hypothetical protein
MNFTYNGGGMENCLGGHNCAWAVDPPKMVTTPTNHINRPQWRIMREILDGQESEVRSQKSEVSVNDNVDS